MENNENRTIPFYKVSISIIFGILGFAINFHTIKFPFPPYIAVVLIGLLFPMLITLSWGWKYGLLSALTGGCQTMWWLWGPSNGYAIFFVVPTFTLWIVWHGLFASLRKRQDEPKWWLNKYIIEIPFRLISTINLLTLSRWAITLNPPPWTWALDAPNTIPMHFSNFIVIKQAAVGYIILLLSDVLLNFGFVRRFFRLKEVYNQTNTGYIISSSLLIGAVFWFIDSIFGSLAFHTGKTFLELFALNVPSYNIFIRTVFILSCLMGGLLAAKLLRKQRESDIALRENEIKYRTLVEHLPAITYTAALDEPSTTLYVSPQIEKILGISPRAYKADHDFKLKNLHNDDREQVLKEVSHAHKTGQPFVSEYRMISTDGRVVWLRDEALIVKDDRGNPLYLQGVMVDISERKRVEEELSKHREHLEEMVQERTAELESVNRELEAFSYSVSHDLRAPLRGIDGFSQVLLEDYADKLDKDGRHYLERVRAGTQRMGQLIDDILQLSRDGRRKMKPESVDLSELARKISEELEESGPERKVQFIIKEGLVVNGDAHLLQIVFNNLLKNAWKFTSKRSEARIEFGVTEKEGKNVYFVKDNGVGFDMKYAGKLFTPFHRLHRAEEFEGTGIGLANVQRIIHRHGGRIWAESEVDVGTTFFFTL